MAKLLRCHNRCAAGSTGLTPAGGFTLIELIIVVLLISLSAALVAGKNFSQREDLQLKASARQVYSFLLAARSAAVLKQQPNVCTYSPCNNTIYSSLNRRRVNLPVQVKLDMARLGEQRAEEQRAEEQRDIELLTYYADGAASSASLCLTNGRKQLGIAIDPLLGFVKLYPYCNDRDGHHDDGAAPGDVEKGRG